MPAMSELLERHGALLKLVGAALLLAWLLTKTSASLVGNVPLALLSVLTLRCLLASLDRQQRWQLREGRARRSDADPAAAPAVAVPRAATAKPDAWRKFVRAPVVEEAWCRFCGSIVQEFVYDSWYGSLTPDKEFPAAVRQLLNSAFGRLAGRARATDLRALLHDLADLFMEQLELYRDTRESILLATQQPSVLRDMVPPARERALRREMAAEKNLHPALQTPEGHYQYLRAVAEGVVAQLLDEADQQRPTARPVCRELLAACVLRPLLQYASPYYANRGLWALLRESGQKRPSGAEEAEEVTAALAAARSEAMRGHWEFEQRLVQHVEQEDAALAAARELRHRLRGKLAQHTRSRSVDVLPASFDPFQQQPQPGLRREAADDLAVQPRTRSCSPAVGSPAGKQRPPRPQQQQQQQPAVERSGFDVFNVASAMAAALLPGAAQAARRSEDGLEGPPRAASSSSSWLPAALEGLLAPRGRQAAEAEQAALLGGGGGDGWESVEASEASSAQPPSLRDWSSAHLLAPGVDRGAVEGLTPRGASCGGAAAPHSGFVGLARARVVAADLNTSGREFVEFKIHVADDAQQWTVSRRYRNFESLHRQLKVHAAYRLKLPPKRIFVHSNNVEFVEERREQLDRYLQALLAHDQLARTSDLFEFLRAGSQRYELDTPQPQRMHSIKRAASVLDRQQQRKMLGGLSRAVMDGTHSVGRGMASASGAMAGTVKQGVSELASASSRGVVLVSHGVAGTVGAAAGAVKGAATGAVKGAAAGAAKATSGSSEARPAGMSRRVRSVPNGLDRVSVGSAEEAGMVQRGASSTAPSREKSSGLLGRAGNRIRSAMSKDWQQQQQLRRQQQQYVCLDASTHSGSASSVNSDQLAELDASHRSAPAAGTPPSASPSKQPSKLFGGLLRSKSRSASPTKQPRERSPTRKARRGPGGGSRRSSGEGQEPELSASGSDAAASAAGSPRPGSPLASFPVEPGLDADDCINISAPLYDIIDCVFELQTRGFFRRQVFGVARQALSLVAGEAIDQYLLGKLRLLRQQHTVGRIISQLQASLWPGGVWYQYAPAGTASAAAASQPDTAATGGGYQRPPCMDPATFLESSGPPPLDEDEVREAVEALLLRRAPTTLVRVIGKNAYASGTQDLYDMLQSPTFCHQLGYGILEICLAHLFPELKPLFRSLQHGGLG